MIVIDLTEDWRIQSDPYAWALAKRKKCNPEKKDCDGGYKWEAQTWHRTLSDAGDYFAARQWRISTATGAGEAAQRRDYWKGVVDQAFSPFSALLHEDASLGHRHESL